MGWVVLFFAILFVLALFGSTAAKRVIGLVLTLAIILICFLLGMGQSPT